MIRDQFLLDISPEIIVDNVAGGALQLAAEQAKYPQIRNSRPVGKRSYQNKCHLCPHEDAQPAAPIVYLAQVADHQAELCESQQGMAEDPAALDAAIKVEIARRTAKAAPFLEPLRAVAAGVSL